MKILLFFTFVFLISPLNAEQDQFWKHWGDGKAEISSYNLEIPRYREHRKGSSVLVFVTENFLKDKQVKDETGHKDSLPVLKLNHTRDFQTGAYPYRTMLSTFSPIDTVSPIKVSLSAFEWCGNFYSQINARDDHYNFIRHSYFEREADSEHQIKRHKDGIMEDNLFILVRELNKKFKTGSYKILTSLFYTRLRHQKPMWLKAEVSSKFLTGKYGIGDNSYRVKFFEIKTPVRNYKIYVEKDYPRKILAWQIQYIDQGEDLVEKASLVKSLRADYWNMNGEGEELDLW